MAKKKLTKTIWYGSEVDEKGNPIIPSSESINPLERLNEGELYLHLSDKEASLWTLGKDGKPVQVSGDSSLDVDISDYLLKSIWESSFEIKLDNNGNQYLFGKLPIALQYGLTMYADSGLINIPSIAQGLPFDNRTIWYNPSTNQIEVIGGTGGGGEGGVSNFWDLSGIPSWITITKPKYTYSEIEGTPDLSGYATQSWVNTRIDSLINGAPAAYDTLKEIADVLQGNVNSIGDIITALGTKWTQDNTKIANWDTAYSWGNHANAGYALKTYVDDELTKYVTLSGEQTISGKKNFTTGGLFINGSQIIYDSTKKYWKLEGDLLVTGGITMYGDSVSGGSAGATTLGQLQNVGTWADSVADVDRIMYQAAGSSNWVAKSLSSIGGVSGDYLPLSGGVLTSSANKVLELNTTGQVEVGMRFSMSSVAKGWVGYIPSNGTILYNNASKSTLGIKDDGSLYYSKATILHSNNYSNYVLPLSGGRITNTLTIDNSNVGLILHRSGRATPYIRFGQDANNEWGELGVYHDGRLVFWPLVSSQGGYNQWNTVWHSGNDGSGSGLDADLLDGYHVSNFMTFKHDGNNYVNASFTDTNLSKIAHDHYIEFWDSSGGWFNIQCGKVTAIEGGFVGNLSGNASSATKLQTARTIWGQSFDGSGNVDGDINMNGSAVISMASSELQIGAGTFKAYDSAIYGSSIMLYSGGTNFYPLILNSSGNVGIGTTNPAQKLHVNGHIWSDGDIGAQSKIIAYGNVIAMGNIGVGTENPNYKLDVDGVIRSNGAKMYSYEASILSLYRTNPNGGAFIDYYAANQNSQRWRVGSGGDAIFVFEDSSNGDRLSLDRSGNLKAWGGITMFGSSDKRLKKNIRTFKASEELMKLGGVYQFEYNDAEIERNNTYKGTHIGLIYQNVKGTILDKMCYEREDGYGALNYLDTSFISLIAAVGIEHETRIQKLERENKELRQEVERLKSV